MCDANEKLEALKEAKRYLELAYEALDDAGKKVPMSEIEQMMEDIDRDIELADEEALDEDRLEDAELARGYFSDAIGDLSSL